MGFQALMEDFGVRIGIRLGTDSSAAKGIAARRGLGKVRHVEVCQVWLQQKVQEGKVKVWKVKGTENPADILTKHVSRDLLAKHMAPMGLTQERGRASSAPSLVA